MIKWVHYFWLPLAWIAKFSLIFRIFFNWLISQFWILKLWICLLWMMFMNWIGRFSSYRLQSLSFQSIRFASWQSSLSEFWHLECIPLNLSQTQELARNCYDLWFECFFHSQKWTFTLWYWVQSDLGIPFQNFKERLELLWCYQKFF